MHHLHVLFAHNLSFHFFIKLVVLNFKKITNCIESRNEIFERLVGRVQKVESERQACPVVSKISAEVKNFRGVYTV
jgi:hypothetical protein